MRRPCRRLSYAHKVKSKRDVYFFANSSARNVETKITLRGKKRLSAWDPHSGTQHDVSFATADAGQEPVTSFTLSLAPSQSIFILGEDDD